MLLPLVFHGAGRLSIDRLLIKLSGRDRQLNYRTGGLQSAGLALLVLSPASIWVEPVWGITLLVAPALAVLIPAITGKHLANSKVIRNVVLLAARSIRSPDKRYRQGAQYKAVLAENVK